MKYLCPDFKTNCMLLKEDIKAAIRGFEIDPDTGEEFPISQELATKIVLDSFYSVVYQYINEHTAIEALEKILSEVNDNPNEETINRLINYHMEFSKQEHDKWKDFFEVEDNEEDKLARDDSSEEDFVEPSIDE